jgi:hypothetical protein
MLIASAAATGRPCWRPRTCPLCGHGALWSQYLHGAHPCCSSGSLQSYARATATEHRMKRDLSISPNQRPGQVSFSAVSESVEGYAAHLSCSRPKSSRWHSRSKATTRRKMTMVQPTHGLSCAGLGARQGKCGWRPVAKASLHRALQQNISVKRHFSPYFPCLSLGHSLRCFSRALRHSAFCFALRAPFWSGFPNKKSPAQSARGSAQRTGEIFSPEPPQKDTPSALGSGAPRVASRKSVPRAIRANTNKEK